MVTSEQQRRLIAHAPMSWQRTGRLASAPQVTVPIVLIGIAAYRLVLLRGNAAPPSADAGNWLSYSRQLFGEPARAAQSIYLPILPFLVRLLVPIFGPLPALKLLGTVLSVLLGVPFFLLIRKACGDLLGVLLMAGFVMAGYQVETLAYGAYPQILGSTWVLLSLWLLYPGLASGHRRRLVLSSLCSAMAIGTHISGIFDVMAVIPIFAGFVWIQERLNFLVMLRRLAIWSFFSIGFSIPFAPYYLKTIQLLDGNPAGPQGYSIRKLGVSLAYVFGEQRILWMLLVSAAAVVVLLWIGMRRGDPIWPTVAALFIGPAVLFAATSEIRVFQLFQAGVIAALAAYVSNFRQWAHGLSTNVRRAPLVDVSYIAGAMLVVVTLIASGHQHAEKAFAFYQAVDSSGVEALNWLKQRPEPGEVLVTTDSPVYGSPTYGWWIEGYAHWPAYQATDPRWFSFKDEKEQAAVANRLLAADLTSDELDRMVAQYRIRYVFIDVRSSRMRDEVAALGRAGFVMDFENQRFVILEPSKIAADTAGG